MLPQPGRMYSKERTSLAERSIQTVRAQQKCLMAYLEHKIGAAIPEEHVLRGWAMVHAAWLLNRYHLTSSNGVTAYMAVRGRPYLGQPAAEVPVSMAQRMLAYQRRGGPRHHCSWIERGDSFKSCEKDF